MVQLLRLRIRSFLAQSNCCEELLRGGDVNRKRFQQKEMSREGDFETKSLSMERDVERKGCQENEVQRDRDVHRMRLE